MTQKLGPLGPIFYTPTKVAPMSLWIKFWVNAVQTFKENRQKPIFWPFLALFWAKRTQNLAHRGHFSHTPISTHSMPINQVPWYHIKNFLRKWPKNSKIHIFCNKRFIKKLKQKIYLYNFWAMLLCTFKPNIERSDEIWGTLFDLKEGWRWTDRRADDGQLGIG